MDNVHSIFPLNTKQTFTEDEANKMVNLLLTITRTTKDQINVLNSRIQCHTADQQKVMELQDEVNDKVRRWSDKMNRLGLIPIALWKVKIPSRSSEPFVWEFPMDCVE